MDTRKAGKVTLSLAQIEMCSILRHMSNLVNAEFISLICFNLRSCSSDGMDMM